MARTRASARPLTEHDEIRRWAEERNAKPAHVKRTGRGEDVGMIRLDFPGYSGNESLEEISWDDWFEKFDERNLALLVEDETAQGQKSNFNKLVRRDTVADTNGGRSSTRRNQRTKSQDAEEPAGAEKFSSDADADEVLDVDEEIETEERPAARRRQTASGSGRARQPRPSARKRSATARKSPGSRSRAARSSARSSARGQGSRTKARSSASTKKPATPARGAQRTSTRGRSAGRRRAA